MSRLNLLPELQEKIEELKDLKVPEDRKEVLKPLISFIQKKKDEGRPVPLNFICTHNSRRSQLGQIWAKAISAYFGIDTECFSGGTEETAFHQNAIDALKRAGFQIEEENGKNPHFKVHFAKSEKPFICYSKVYDSEENPSHGFAAVMTCSHADENCPFIPGAETRIALDYKDPKAYDGTAQVNEKYDERSDQIASEMIYVFKNIK
ncbi:protein-tyrosine-phosphatase [Gramella jeungdoensis]|uniref:Protein-tyrosine-phosphatase n=1 Tax=Gramella jeungdoensis TaxID=708091 RepID=A0ABT0YZD1_9FLAO|nr:protein-tyrosine-phosphatase [Gramella jeungdoensis]MCM8568257.1 protein-tyrosine-phosphatase [Gramella jeungdoensis]